MDDRGARRAERAAAGALAVTLLFAAAKVAVWAATGSLAVLSQAADSALDVVALGLVLFSLRVARRPADASHHYGHAKAENLVAYTQTIVLIAIAGGIALEAIARLGSTGQAVGAPWYALALLATSAVVDAARARALGRVATEAGSEALRAGALNIATDVGTALVALASLALVRAGVERADSAGGLIVAVAVAVAAVRLGRRSVGVLMDRAPEAPVQAIEDAAASAPGVSEARRVRVRTTGRQLFADVTVGAQRTASLERAHDIAEAVERAIQRVAPGTDVVVHVEPAPETSEVVERALAAASRVGGVHEVHNVLVHEFERAGRPALHVTLHAKVDPETPLERAHALSDAVETEVERELGGGVRVDTHIEPLERAAPGTDVTGGRTDLVAEIEALAAAEPEIVDCHEVLVTQSGDATAVVVHVRGDPALPLAEIHAASERIEKKLVTAHPEINSVLIHFEPA